MSKRRILTHNSIIEALLDFQVISPANANIYSFESIFEGIKNNYPIKQLTSKHQAKFVMNGSDKPDLETRSDINGFMFKSADGGHIFQARRDGFTINYVKSYADWESFLAEAKKMWKLYFSTISPTKIQRIGLRYINKINIPAPIDNLKDYILTYPEIAEELPQGMEEFFSRIVIPSENGLDHAIITMTFDLPSCSDKNLALVFDIDVFRLIEINADNDKVIYDTVDSIKEFANKIFFGSLTEKALGLLT
jgi:uncharacterized protein (TIGR04255 family)